MLGRAFMVDNDTAIPMKAIRDGVKIYRCTPGGHGTSVATFLAGDGPLAPPQAVPETTFIEGSGRSFNTIPPNDFGFWHLIDSLIQEEPVGMGGPEILGLLASIGIAKGRSFDPDERMRKILDEAVVVGKATARTISFDPRNHEEWAFYPGSQWFNMLFAGGYDFLNPPPQVTPQGVVPTPSDGARKINARIAFFYPYTGITPAMRMSLTSIGSQYLIALKDSAGEYLDGARNYRLTLPPDIPHARFWSVVPYDRQTRSMLQTGQSKPDVSSQSGVVETNADSSTGIFFGPTAPDGKEGNWLETVPGKGWFPILRLYSPLASFFDKSSCSPARRVPGVQRWADLHDDRLTGARYLGSGANRARSPRGATR